MDFALFALSVILLFFSRKIEWPIIGMLVLTTDYLGIGSFFVEHELNRFEPKDLALVLSFIIMIVVFHRYKFVRKPQEIQWVNKYIWFFFGFLFISIIIDLISNAIDLWSILRTSRHWLMLLMFLPIMRIPKIHLEATIKILYYLTLIVSAIIVFEYISGLHYFTKESYMTVEGAVRGRLPSTFALFYTLFVALGYGNHRKLVRYAILAMLSFSLLLSATKSIALGLFLGFVIWALLRSKNIMSALFRIVGVIAVSFMVIAMMPNLRTRIIYGSQVFGRADDGSSTFRLMLAQERYNYISKDPVTFVFGIGNVTEDHFRGNFKVGYVNAEGVQSQLDTGDIAWALSFLRLGLLGTLIWTGLSLMFVWCFYRRLGHPCSIPLISYMLLNLIVLSFAGTFIFKGIFWIVPLICLNIVYPIEQKNLRHESNTYRIRVGKPDAVVL